MPQHTTFYVLLETSRHFTRMLLRGVIRWSKLYGPVTIVASSGHIEQELPKIKMTEKVGIIARLSTPGVIEAKKFGIPVVTIEPSLDELLIQKNELEISEIISNSRKIARLGAGHFLARGFRSFAFCGLPRRIWSDIREKEFDKEIAVNGFECSVYPIPDPSRVWTRQEEHPYLAKWLATLPKPVAIMTCNDDRAAQIIETCNFEGWLVPEQVAVLGVDNDDLICELTQPALSSISLDLENAGFQTAELLWGLISRRVSGYHCIPLEPIQVVTRLSSDVAGQGDALIRQAIRYIRDNYQYQIGAGDVAKALDVSRRTLERRFATTLGRSIHDQIHFFRMEQARELLIVTNDPVERIAQMTGFGNLKQMLRSFLKFENQTPTQFRKLNR